MTFALIYLFCWEHTVTLLSFLLFNHKTASSRRSGEAVVRVVHNCRKDILSGQKQKATHANFIQWKLIGRIQANGKEVKCNKDSQASLEMENYQQLPSPSVSHSGVSRLFLSAIVSCALSKQLRSAFPRLSLTTELKSARIEPRVCRHLTDSVTVNQFQIAGRKDQIGQFSSAQFSPSTSINFSHQDSSKYCSRMHLLGCGRHVS